MRKGRSFYVQLFSTFPALGFSLKSENKFKEVLPLSKENTL